MQGRKGIGKERGKTMLIDIVIIWMMIKLQAPPWCFWSVGIGMLINIAQVFIAVGKEIGKNKNDAKRQG